MSACFSTQSPTATAGSAAPTISTVLRRFTSVTARGSTVKTEASEHRLKAAIEDCTGRKIAPTGMKTSAEPKPAKP